MLMIGVIADDFQAAGSAIKRRMFRCFEMMTKGVL